MITYALASLGIIYMMNGCSYISKDDYEILLSEEIKRLQGYYADPGDVILKDLHQQENYKWNYTGGTASDDIKITYSTKSSTTKQKMEYVSHINKKIEELIKENGLRNH